MGLLCIKQISVFFVNTNTFYFKVVFVRFCCHRHKLDNRIPVATITAEQCRKDDLSKRIVGKIFSIRADVLRREYQTADHQLVLPRGGFGVQGNARGSAVYITHLYGSKP